MDKIENSLVGGFIGTNHDQAGPVKVEPIRHDRLSRPNDDEAGARLSDGPSGRGGWPKGRKRRTKLAVLGIPSAALDEGNPAYARCVRLASAYRKSRVRELSISHGYVSSGASALLASASMALASSRYLYEQAAKGCEEQLEYLKVAAKLADSARQNELAAWELCAREAVANKKAQHASAGIPWVVEVDDVSGYQKKKPGPRSKKAREEEILALPPVGQPLDGWVQSATLNGEVIDGTEEEA